MTEFMQISVSIAAVTQITINRPKQLNALNTATLTELDQALDLIENSNEVRVVIIRGSVEKAFVAGADIKEMKDKDAIEATEFSRLGNSVFERIATLSQPVIAAVNGFALGGGCELALACDIRYASENAVFGQPEVGLGIPPGFGGTQRLARLVGPGYAKELIFTAKNIKSDEALRIGLVNKVVALEDLDSEVKKVADRIAKQAPIAVESSKALINQGLDLPLANALELEALSFGSHFATEDQTNGMDAFVNKEKPTFNKK